MESVTDSGNDLYDAASKSDLKRVQSILDGGKDSYDINARHPHNGYTALYIAAAWGIQDGNSSTASTDFYYYEIAQLLLDFGADTEILSGKGCTPLYIASSWAHTNIVKLLIKYNANLDAVNNDGRTALHIAAISRPRFTKIRVLKRYKYQSYFLAKSYMEEVGDNDQIAGFLTTLKEDYKLLRDNLPASPDEDISNKIMDVVKFYNHFATVVALVEAGAQVNIQDGDRKETPLAKAVLSGHLPMVKYLVEKGADVNVVDHYNVTPLEIAEGMHHSHVVEYLQKIQQAST